MRPRFNRKFKGTARRRSLMIMQMGGKGVKNWFDFDFEECGKNHRDFINVLAINLETLKMSFEYQCSDGFRVHSFFLLEMSTYFLFNK